MAKTLRFEALYPYDAGQGLGRAHRSRGDRRLADAQRFRARVGHLFTMRTKPAPGFDGIVQCEVLEVEPPRALAYSWKGGGIDTLVRYELKEEGGNTRLIMEQSGFTGIKGFLVSRILGGGWKKIIGEHLKRAAGRVEDGVYRPD